MAALRIVIYDFLIKEVRLYRSSGALNGQTGGLKASDVFSIGKQKFLRKSTEIAFRRNLGGNSRLMISG